MLLAKPSLNSDREWAVQHWWDRRALSILNSWATAETAQEDPKNLEPGQVCHPTTAEWSMRKLALMNERLQADQSCGRGQVTCFCLPTTHFMPSGCACHMPWQRGAYPSSFCPTCSLCQRCGRHPCFNSFMLVSWVLR